VEEWGADERAPRAKRYAFGYAFGILTGDDDDDKQAVVETERSQAKPAQPQPVTAKPYNPQEEVVKLMKKPGVDTSIEDKDKLRKNSEAVVLSLMNHAWAEENDTEILNRLSVRLEETTGAQKL
jgi:hypothetical protein